MLIDETFFFPPPFPSPSPPLLVNSILERSVFIGAYSDHEGTIPTDMIYARMSVCDTRHVTRDNRAPFFNSMAIMQSLLKTITMGGGGGGGGNPWLGRLIAGEHVTIKIINVECVWMYQTNYRSDRLKIETVVPRGHFNFQREPRLFE